MRGALYLAWRYLAYHRGKTAILVTSIALIAYPLHYFAERIGGEQVKSVFPAPPDVDPADWIPDPEIVSAYQAADLILQNGAGYAGWIKRASLPKAKLVDTSRDFADPLIPRRGEVTHAHGPAGKHSHSGTAYTTWLDPRLAIQQARAVATAFAGARPEHSDFFAEQLKALEADLLALDRRLEAAARELGDAPLLFSHPVYAYLERRYALNGRSLHWEPGEPPGPPSWRELETLLAEHPARVMIWEAQPPPETERRLGTLRIRAVVYSPCGNAPARGDWLSLMYENAATLESAARLAVR